MLRGENIVCFAKEWESLPSSNHHFMRRLARHNKVLWLNSIVTRTPHLSSARDVRKIIRKLGTLTEGVTRVEDNLWVYTPIVLPYPYNRRAQRFNRHILRSTISLLRRKLDMDEFQVWSFLPTASEYCGRLGESMMVYFCIYEWSEFAEMDTEAIQRMDRDMCERADIVFASSRSLYEPRRRYNDKTFLVTNGVDHLYFARAMDPSTPEAPALAAIPRPILGYFGLIRDFIDQDLIAFLARERPTWSIVLLGESIVNTSKIERLPNVYILDREPYEHLPQFCKVFSVGLLPYKVNELTRHFNPGKLREYLSAGLPVVSTPLDEARRLGDLCYVAENREQFLAACDRAIAEDTPAEQKRRSDSMKTETWEHKLAEACEHIRAVQRAYM